MKKIHFILVSLLIVITIACSDTAVDKEMILSDCSVIANSKILTEAERDEACIYNDVYLYKSDIYLVCECCVCDKYYIAINCDTTALCDFSEDCMDNFRKKATYLFSVE